MEENCVDYDNFKAKRNEYNIILKELRSKHLAERINKCKGNSKALFKVVNSALNRKPESPLPHHIDDMSLASEFSKFFDEKIETIRSKLHENHDPIIMPFFKRNSTGLAFFLEETPFYPTMGRNREETGFKPVSSMKKG